MNIYACHLGWVNPQGESVYRDGNVEAIKVDNVAAAVVQQKYSLLPVTLQFLWLYV